MRITVIFLVCATAFSSAQLQDEQKTISIPLRATRYQKLSPAARPSTGSQTIFPNQRIRRPISFKPKLNSGDNASSGALRTLRPGISTVPATFTQQVKPVNEEPEEENITHESSRERNENFNSHDQSPESQSEEELIEENIPRPIPNSFRLAAGLGSPLPAPLQPISITAYRPFQQVVTVPTTRGSPATTIPPPLPVQYHPEYRSISTQKPTKAPRKQIVDDAFRQQIKAPLKPVKPSQAYEIRGKKPVAQIIRRYRHDNSDGSITWGFENDDGSYKEETIGVDCITSGKYGYIDPDGIQREYTYQTGIKCDEQQREEVDDGFVDYQENKLVLPSGKTIDLSSMGKKQVRRPQPLYRN